MNSVSFVKDLEAALAAAKRGDNTLADIVYQRMSDAGLADPEILAALILLMLETGHYEQALEKAQELIALRPEEAQGHCLKGRALEALHDYEVACGALVQAVKQDPGLFDAQYHLGRVLRQVGLPQQAAERYMEALKLDQTSAELYYHFGFALSDLGHVESAVQAYRQAIHLKPDYREAHQILNNLYWAHGRHNLFLRSYEDALQQVPDAEGLSLDYADRQMHLGRYAEAGAILKRALDRRGGSAELAHGFAKVKAMAEQWDEAEIWFEKSIEGNADNFPVRRDYSRVLLLQGAYDKAEYHIRKARTLKPLDQETLSYEWLCLKLQDKPEAAALYDYDRFVRVFDLEAPEGFSSMADFNRALAKHLHTLHKTKTHPFDQTLRHGTQTHGFLFDSDHELIRALQTTLEKAVGLYIQGLPDDPDHPFLGRKGAGFSFAGSWSVRLSQNGHHFNHVHSSGWISSAYYVELPDDLDDSRKEGWIKFGETNLDLGEKEETGKIIRPEAGRLVLFPSYMFHGTIPIQSEKPRMTVAFDIVPTG